VLLVTSDAAERHRLAVAGRDRVRSHHDWSRSMQRLDTLIAGCIRGRAERDSRTQQNPA